MLDHAREIIKNNKKIFNGVGTQFVSSYRKTNANLKKKIQGLLEDYNSKTSCNLSKNDIFNKVEEQPILCFSSFNH